MFTYVDLMQPCLWTKFIPESPWKRVLWVLESWKTVFYCLYEPWWQWFVNMLLVSFLPVTSEFTGLTCIQHKGVALLGQMGYMLGSAVHFLVNMISVVLWCFCHVGIMLLLTGCQWSNWHFAWPRQAGETNTDHERVFCYKDCKW